MRLNLCNHGRNSHNYGANHIMLGSWQCGDSQVQVDVEYQDPIEYDLNARNWPYCILMVDATHFLLGTNLWYIYLVGDDGLQIVTRPGGNYTPGADPFRAT